MERPLWRSTANLVTKTAATVHGVKVMQRSLLLPETVMTGCRVYSSLEQGPGGWPTLA